MQNIAILSGGPYLPEQSTFSSTNPLAMLRLITEQYNIGV